MPPPDARKEPEAALRTTGTDAHKYAITDPGWKGDLPPA